MPKKFVHPEGGVGFPKDAADEEALRKIGYFEEGYPKRMYRDSEVREVNGSKEEKALGEGWVVFDEALCKTGGSYRERYIAAVNNPGKQASILDEYRTLHPALARADSWYKEKEPKISELQTQAMLKLLSDRQAEDRERHATEAEATERKDKAERAPGPRLQSGRKNPLKNYIITLYLEDPTRSQEDICGKLDPAMEKNPKLAPLGQWQKESGQKTWSHNLRHPKTKNRVKTYLSKIKADALKLLANRS